MKPGLAGTAALAAALPAVLAGQEPQATPAPATFGVSTAAVVLDVVVKDKKGHAVRDLGGADFEVYEDGVRQQIQSFQVVSREPASASSPGPAPVAPASPRPPEATVPARPTPGFVALVFDRLSPEARSLAGKAALAYLGPGLQLDERVGVFVVDLSLHTLQDYTDDGPLVRRAVERAAARSSTAFASQREALRGIAERQSALDTPSSPAAGASGGGPGAGQAAQAAASAEAAVAPERALLDIESRMRQTFEALERDQQGYATTNGLMAVVDALRLVPGRKTVVFFSEGIAIPPAVEAQFRSVINSANRANVSIYTMDAAGLRVESNTAETRRELDTAARQRLRQLGTGRDDTSKAMMKDLERNEDMLRLDPEGGLGRLAAETGGFLIANTNDLGAGFRRIDEDMRFHYVLAYVPSNESYDGRFRQLAVKVARPGVVVQSRQGYYAVRSAGPVPVLAYEAPALALLDRAPLPSDIPLRAGALSFPEAGRPGLAPVLVEVPGRAVTYAPDADKKTWHADLVVVARIKDEAQQVVQKMSQHYLLGAPAEQVESARKGDVLFYREADLKPGRYTVEAVAYDAGSGQAGVRASALEVPAAGPASLRMSSLAIVKRAERVPESERKAATPLYYGDALIYPNLGEPLLKSAAKEVAFFFTVYTAGGVPPPTTASVEVLMSGRSLGRATAGLPAPDATGRIQHVGALPLQAFGAGTYELKVSVSDGRSTATRSAAFKVEG